MRCSAVRRSATSPSERPLGKDAACAPHHVAAVDLGSGKVPAVDVEADCAAL